MTVTVSIQLFDFLLAAFVGFQTISRIPPLLHTPLMAATNAISGISLVASLVLAGSDHGVFASTLGTVAVACAVANVVGGSLTVTGSLMAFGKLQGILPGRPITFRGQNALNFALLLASAVCLVIPRLRCSSEMRSSPSSSSDLRLKQHDDQCYACRERLSLSTKVPYGLSRSSTAVAVFGSSRAAGQKPPVD